MHITEYANSSTFGHPRTVWRVTFTNEEEASTSVEVATEELAKSLAHLTISNWRVRASERAKGKEDHITIAEVPEGPYIWAEQEIVEGDNQGTYHVECSWQLTMINVYDLTGEATEAGGTPEAGNLLSLVDLLTGKPFPEEGG